MHSTQFPCSASLVATSHSGYSQPARINLSRLSDQKATELACDFAAHYQEKSPNTLESPHLSTLHFNRKLSSFYPTWQPLVINKRHPTAKSNDIPHSPRVANHSHALPVMSPPFPASPDLSGRPAITQWKQSSLKSLEDYPPYLTRASSDAGHSKTYSPTSSLTSFHSPRSFCINTPISTSPESTNTSASSSSSKRQRWAKILHAYGDYSPTVRRFIRAKRRSPTNKNTTTSFGLPDDMLDILDDLERLAKDVGRLELKKFPSFNERALRAISSSTQPFTRSLKEKWHKRSSLIDIFSVEHNEPPPDLNPQHEWLYNPEKAPEFLVGPSTGNKLYRGEGYHSRPVPRKVITHSTRPKNRKYNLPRSSETVHGAPKDVMHITGVLSDKSNLSPRTVPPRDTPLSNKLSAVKSLFSLPRPRTRSVAAIKSAIPHSHTPIENLPLPKTKFLWIRI